MRRLFIICFLLAISSGVRAHDPGAPPPTWNREISRIFYDRCASCHRPGGTSFPLITYQDAQPRALAIKTTVLSRQMPPWGAVKGFGDFRNDEGLTQEQISLITDWVEGDTPKGNNPNALPPLPKFETSRPFVVPPNAVAISGEFVVKQPMLLEGLLPRRLKPHASFQIVAVRPDGSIEPLLWLYEYEDAYKHPFLFRKPVNLATGTVIHGVPRDAAILLLPAS
jgi:hypothetical protein